MELNDPVGFNWESPELMADLVMRLQQVRERGTRLVESEAMVLQGAGPHFCTGGGRPDGSIPDSERDRGPSSWWRFPTSNQIALMLRELPVPTICAVHGKLIGGGVALALAADLIVSADGATFSFGNLPRGMNPLFMLSRSMSLTVGQGMAEQLYLEDPVLTANEAFAAGLVSEIAGNVGETKLAALEHASRWAKGDTAFMHGPVSRVCSSMPAHSAREVSLMVTRIVRDLKKTKPASLSRSKPAATSAPVLASRVDPRWLGLSSEELNVRVLAEVRNACNSVIGDSADLEDDMPLMEAGVDSLGATELANALKSNTGLEFDSMVLFSHPTISQLVAHITHELQRSIDLESDAPILQLDPRWKGLSSEELETQIDSFVRQAVESVLGDVANLDDDIPLMEAGVDSLGATELRNVLHAESGLELDSMVLFSHPTIRQLKAHIVTSLKQPKDRDNTTRSSQSRRFEDKLASIAESNQVAIVGMGGRFPGGIEGPAMLWDAVQAGKSMLGKVPFNRWDADAVSVQRQINHGRHGASHEVGRICRRPRII